MRFFDNCRSPHESQNWSPTVPERSYVHHLLKMAGMRLREGGDWVWLRNMITGEELRATEALDKMKR